MHERQSEESGAALVIHNIARCAVSELSATRSLSTTDRGFDVSQLN
jgi:hypothetical protein